MLYFTAESPELLQKLAGYTMLHRNAGLSILSHFLFIFPRTPAPSGEIFPSSIEVGGRIPWAAGL